jgi:Family of unknown function (DUF5519)
MNVSAQGTLDRAAKGPVAPPPVLEGPLQSVVETIASWPGIMATVHWYLMDHSRIDGVDFYFRDQELGHLHLDGTIHLATPAALGQALIAEGLARPFRYQAGWVEEQVQRVGADAAVALFRRNYEHLQTQAIE